MGHLKSLYWICYSIASVVCFLAFWPQGTWNLNSLIMDWTHIPCIGRQSFNHWTAREGPILPFNTFNSKRIHFLLLLQVSSVLIIRQCLKGRRDVRGWVAEGVVKKLLPWSLLDILPVDTLGHLRAAGRSRSRGPSLPNVQSGWKADTSQSPFQSVYSSNNCFRHAKMNCLPSFKPLCLSSGRWRGSGWVRATLMRQRATCLGKQP